MTPVFSAASGEVPLTVRPMRTARGLRLSVDPLLGRVLLTMPTRGSRRAALAWAEGRRGWIEARLAEMPAGRPFEDGAVIPFDDASLTVVVRGAGRSAARIDDTLVVGGAPERIGARVATWLRREALRLLSEDTAHFAGRAGVSVSGVRVGDPRRRWGSCSSSGTIAYSWRLALAPRFVRRSVVAHEVAHRLHLDHSPAFHAAHRAVGGEDPAPASAWLRRHGAELHLFGRGRRVG